MNDREIARRLAALRDFDGGMVRSYNEALAKLDRREWGVCRNFSVFREEHRRHVAVIESLVRELGQELPPLPGLDDTPGGEHRDSVGEANGVTEVLFAMQNLELRTQGRYAELLGEPEFEALPDEVQEFLNSAFDDERSHSAYIDSVLHMSTIVV